MKNLFKRYFSIMLALLLLTAAVLPAAAAESEWTDFDWTAQPLAVNPFSVESDIYIISNTLKAYKSPNTSSKVLGNMSYGEHMTLVGFSGDWVKIRNSSGALGYCKLNGVGTVDPNTLNETVYVSRDKAPVYAKPGTSFKVLGKMKKGAALTAVAKTSDGNWLRVKNGSRIGYIQTTNTAAAKPDGGSTVYITANTLKAYAGQSTSSKVLGNMSYGESMRMLSSSGDWAKIMNSSGAVGYCKVSGLSAKDPNTLNSTVFVMVNKTPVYAKPGTNYKVLGRMNINSTLTALAKTPDGSWYRVKNGSRIGYISASSVW